MKERAEADTQGPQGFGWKSTGGKVYTQQNGYSSPANEAQYCSKTWAGRITVTIII